jgi:hypothetical protein
VRHIADKPILRLLILHDDANREVEYTSGAEQALEKAAANDWTVVSVKNDWAPSPKRTDGDRRSLAAATQCRRFVGQIPRICFFLAAYSSSVRIPSPLSFASCSSSAA